MRVKGQDVKYIIKWLFIFIIGSLIVTFLVIPSSFSNFKENMVSIFSSNDGISSQSTTDVTDPFIKKCIDTIDECFSVSKQKFGSAYSVKILYYERFNNESDASKFYNTWSNPYQIMLSPFREGMSDKPYGEISYPVVLFATRIENNDIVNPAVAICNSNGSLYSLTKTVFQC